MKFKKFFSAMVAALTASSLMSICLPTNADEENNLSYDIVEETINNFASDEELYRYLEQYGGGALEFDSSVAVPECDQILTSEATAKADLPSSVDLSTSPCFPSIGDQSLTNSCTAFATTYYQFSYEVNKLNNVTSVEDQVVYSPKWTYNNINGGNNNGTYIWDAYNILINFGSLTLDELPFDYNYTYIPGNTLSSSDEMIEERINALNTRVSSYGELVLPTSGTFITSSDDDNLYLIKSMLNDGKVLTTTTSAAFNKKSGYGEYSNIEICYRNYRTSGHAMTVVGYDDNICCDVNNNGTIEECEKGAFKLANSWGTNNDNEGYIWVLYDAINDVSANITNDWESNLSGERCQAFKWSDSYPALWYIYVENKEVNYIGEIELDTDYYNALSLQISRTASTSSSPIYTSSILPQCSSSEVHYEGKIYFDYDLYCSPITNYLSGYKWYANLSPCANDSLSARFRIIDNKENEIASYEAVGSEMALSNEKYKIINTKVGDLNFSSFFDQADALIIQSYLSNNLELSTLQKNIADANGNGVIDIADAVYILSKLEV